MIATIKTHPVTSQSVTQHSPPSFESFLKILNIQFRHACRFMRHRHEREEAIQEMTALAFALYKRLSEHGRTDIFSTPIGNYAIRSYFDGRRFTGMSATDITSPRCQRLDRAIVHGFDYCGSSDNRVREIFICDKHHSPSTIACFNIDFEAWTNSLDTRKREILFAILDGNSTSELAKRFGVSPGRISQLRQELTASWHEFADGNNDDTDIG